MCNEETGIHKQAQSLVSIITECVECIIYITTAAWLFCILSWLLVGNGM